MKDKIIDRIESITERENKCWTDLHGITRGQNIDLAETKIKQLRDFYSKKIILEVLLSDL